MAGSVNTGEGVDGARLPSSSQKSEVYVGGVCVCVVGVYVCLCGACVVCCRVWDVCGVTCLYVHVCGVCAV